MQLSEQLNEFTEDDHRKTLEHGGWGCTHDVEHQRRHMTTGARGGGNKTDTSDEKDSEVS